MNLFATVLTSPVLGTPIRMQSLESETKSKQLDDSSAQADSASETSERFAEQLRRSVIDALSKHMYKTATYFADKLVTVTQGRLSQRQWELN